MSETCSGSCESCQENCSSRKPESLLAEANPQSHVKKVIAVVSGKGGVGKSTVTSLFAVSMEKLGYKTAILDADITGPSIPKAFGLHEPAVANDDGILPAQTRDGIKVMSINLLLENETDPVVWRGPVLAGAVKQFWTDVCWGDVDYMFVDLPPGTGDVPLTVFQSLPINGVILVTSPQELVSMIVSKAVNMTRMMNVPLYGFVENYSYLTCPDCGKRIEVFGKSKLDEIALSYSLPILARLPIDPKLAELLDEGKLEDADVSAILPAAELITKAK
jgi:Mrp family chromosome partitioning ATPase